MNKISRIMLSPIKHLIGLGYGECKCCGFHWNTVDEHSIPIGKYRGVFAVCEDCWKNKSDDEIITAHNKMYDDWLLGDKYNTPLSVAEIGFTRKVMLDSLKKELGGRRLNSAAIEKEIKNG